MTTVEIHGQQVPVPKIDNGETVLDVMIMARVVSVEDRQGRLHRLAATAHQKHQTQPARGRKVHPMRPAYIPEVPDRITRQQVIDAARVLGLEPYTVHSIQFDATAVHVTIGLYSTPDPGFGDDMAFYRGFGEKTGITITERIPVSHPGPFGDGVMPV